MSMESEVLREMPMRTIQRRCSCCHQPFDYRSEQREGRVDLAVDAVCRRCFPAWLRSFEAALADPNPTSGRVFREAAR
ncbi:MAG: hypothetical protein M1272_08195 [Firmicutes bacterium]|nr:hypothetical protein [Bacillota bacterium]